MEAKKGKHVGGFMFYIRQDWICVEETEDGRRRGERFWVRGLRFEEEMSSNVVVVFAQCVLISLFKQTSANIVGQCRNGLEEGFGFNICDYIEESRLYSIVFFEG